MMKKWISAILILVLLLSMVTACGKKEEPKEETPPVAEEEKPVEKPSYVGDEVVSFALYGVDTLSSTYAGRSDTVIIVSLDKKNKEIRLSAIMRDAYVEMDHPKRGKIKDKLNHAFAFGGGELSVKTINENFGLNIKDYAAINFTNLEKLVDALGGIDMEITKNYRSEANHHISALASQRGISPKLIKDTGVQHLNGMQMLGVLRCRKQVGGIEVRSKTNQIFLEKCYEKLKALNPADYAKVAATLIGMIKTSMTAEEITNIATEVLTEGYTIRRAVFPRAEDFKGGYGGKTIKGTFYTTFNPETTPKHLQDFVFEGKLPESK